MLLGCTSLTSLLPLVGLSGMTCGMLFCVRATSSFIFTRFLSVILVIYRSFLAFCCRVVAPLLINLTFCSTKHRIAKGSLLEQITSKCFRGSLNLRLQMITWLLMKILMVLVIPSLRLWALSDIICNVLVKVAPCSAISSRNPPFTLLLIRDDGTVVVRGGNIFVVCNLSTKIVLLTIFGLLCSQHLVLLFHYCFSIKFLSLFFVSYIGII